MKTVGHPRERDACCGARPGAPSRRPARRAAVSRGARRWVAALSSIDRGAHASPSPRRPRLPSPFVLAAPRRPRRPWPVSERNTSSKVGPVQRDVGEPDLGSSRRRTLSQERDRPFAADRQRGPRRLGVHVRLAGPDALRAPRATRGRSPRCSTWSSRTSPPIWSFSSSDVPSAITVPRSITAIRSASWSASSRYCVVSSSVVPSRLQLADEAPTRRSGCAGRGPSSARRGTARSGRPTRLAARSSRRRMPPEYVFDGPVGGIGEVEPLEQSRRRACAASALRGGRAGRPSRGSRAR